MFKLIVILRPYSKYLLILWILTIITVSSIPNIPTLKIHTSKSEIRLDYLLHICEYGFLTFVTLLSFAGTEFIIRFRKVILLAMSLILFAILDELHQKLIPGRSYNIMDILSNITGILTAMAFTLIVFTAIRKR